MPLEAILIVLGILVLAGGFALGQRALEKKRTQQLHELANSLGFDFSPRPDKTLADRFATFSMFKQGHSRTAWNILSGGTDDERLMLFDYRYTVGGGKSQHTHKRTVVCFDSSHLDLPQFELRPETFFDRFTEMFGQKEIDLEAFPEFSRRYHLTSPSERVLEIFNEPLVRKFESLRDVATSGYQRRLVFCRTNKRPSVENFRSLMEDAYAIYALLKQPKTQA